MQPLRFQFHKTQHFIDSAGARPNAGELLVAHATGGRLGLALRAIEKGVDGFPHGDGNIEVISLPATPSFDDMLAAELVKRQLEGQTLPAGCRAFAEYAALVREGLRPAKVPLQESLEAIYQAVLNSAPPADVRDMTNPSVAECVLEGWKRLADRIFEAAAEGLNPCEQPVCTRTKFPREFAFLDRDRDVYQHDVERGERWTVKLPGGPPKASALWLKNPRSLLFMHWCRVDAAAPTGAGYLLLIVWNDVLGWIISTDAVHRMSLKPLHEKLQQAESDAARRTSRPAGAETPADASTTPALWNEGLSFHHTLIGSPCGGTKLSEKEVVRIVRQWSNAVANKSIPVPARNGALVSRTLVACGLGIVAMIGFVASGHLNHSGSGTDPAEMSRGATIEKTFEVSPTISLGERHWILAPGQNIQDFGIDRFWEQDERPCLLSGHLDVSPPHPGKIALADAKLRLINTDGSQSDLPIEMTDRGLRFTNFPVTLSNPNSRVRLEIKSGHDQPLPAKMQLEWQIDSENRPNLYFLSVGVSNFDRYERRLDYADDDAMEISKVLQEQALIFRNVNGRRLVNEEATRARILREVAIIRETQERGKIKPWDMVLITLSGHGVCDPEYCFLPYDYDPAMKEDRVVSAADILSQLKALPCQVVLFVDTCHAGAFRSRGEPGTETTTVPPATVEVESAVQKAISDAWRNEKGLVIFSACLPSQEARESTALKHGVFSMALIEFLTQKDYQGNTLPSGTQSVVSLQDLSTYLVHRVPQLAKSPQEVIVSSEKAVSMSLIPLAVRAHAKPFPMKSE